MTTAITQINTEPELADQIFLAKQKSVWYATSLTIVASDED